MHAVTHGRPDPGFRAYPKAQRTGRGCVQTPGLRIAPTQINLRGWKAVSICPACGVNDVIRSRGPDECLARRCAAAMMRRDYDVASQPFGNLIDQSTFNRRLDIAGQQNAATGARNAQHA